MFPMRLKIGHTRNVEWRCFFCLHVRTATILLGIWHLILHVLALSVLALLMRNHHIAMQDQKVSLDMGNILPTPLSKVKKDDEGPYYLAQDGRPIYASELDLSALMTVFTLAITLLLVYGTVKGKAIHLLPFFCLQIFDCGFSILTASGFFIYLRSGHQFINDHWKSMPFRSELLHMNTQQLSFIILVTFMISLTWKAYCISIVWRCYKFLTLRQSAMRSTIHYILPGEGSERGPEPDYSTLLPDYEAACASAMKQAPPPSYQAAMENQPPAYPDPATAQHVVNLAQVAEEYPYNFTLVSETNVNTNQEAQNASISGENENTNASEASGTASPSTESVETPKNEMSEPLPNAKQTPEATMLSSSQIKPENN